jgi:spermidine/putrescine transport system substrate-binding protein
MNKQIALSALLLFAAVLALPGVGAAAGSEVAPGARPGDEPAAASGERVSGPETNQTTEELLFLTWPDYVDPTLVREFEHEQQVRLRFEYFDSDDARDRLMAHTDGKGFDLLVVDNTAVAGYDRRGWIAPIVANAVPNLRHIDPGLDRAYADTSGLAVPYFWGTLGIAYRTDLVPHPPRSWMDLLRPDAALSGRIMMIADSFDLVGMALKALGHSMNSNDPDALAQAAALLAEQKPAVHRYGTLSLGADSELLTGEVIAAMAYSGDAATLMDQDAAIAYVVPREGGAIWVDYLAINARGRRSLAAAFIDFLNRPEVSARNARHLSYATPNRAAKTLLPAEFLQNPLIYPDAETLAHSEHYAALTPDALRRRVQVYSAIVYGD